MIIHCDTTRFIWEVLENGEYKFLFDDLTVLDVGCNIGAFSLWIRPHTRHIYAVDMEQKYIDLFNQTIRDNEITGISTYTEKVEDLANFMSGHGIDRVDLLKLDVEGDEKTILAADNFPKDRVHTIIGEYHNLPIESHLTRMGYRYTEFPGKHFLARRI